MFDSISLEMLSNVSGGCACGLNRQTPDNFNTGITGGIPGVPNNKVPTPPGQVKRDPGFNTGITGGIPGVPNNQVPRPLGR
jgi:hypothetical protein